MSETIFCDICRKECDFDYHKVSFFKGYWEGKVVYDLCNDCNKDFVNFIKKKRGSKNG